MKVTLINYTPWALETLLLTKSTRLQMSGTSLNEVKEWSHDRKMEEWRYMQDTIKSSWEFVDYIFCIEVVTRAFTHQLVRHRVGTSFAQQSQRTVDMSGFEAIEPEAFWRNNMDAAHAIWCDTVQGLQRAYELLTKNGAKAEDARGILPTNVSTNIIFKANLRTLNGMCAERLCVKAQGEFQNVMEGIRNEVLQIHPWAEPALRVYCAQHGVCCFPRVPWEGEKSCSFKGGIFNPETGSRWDASDIDMCLSFATEDGFGEIERPMTKAEIQAAWELSRRIK